MRKIFLLFLFLAMPSFLPAQTPRGYVLVKTAATPQGSGSTSYQWIASDHTSVGGDDFFILAHVSGGITVRSVTGDAPGLMASPSLPLTGPASLLVGPFSIGPDSSVAFTVTEEGTEKGAGASFRLLTKSQVTQVHALSITLSNPTVTPDETPELGAETAVAAPNISRGGAPINFLVRLSSPAGIKLTVYALTGERVFDEQSRGDVGMNKLLWKVENNARQSVASGLYLYRLEMSGGEGLIMKTGKLLVTH